MILLDTHTWIWSHSATWLLSDNVKKFPYGKKEIEIILKQGEKSNNPLTSSCGRILDALAALLDICWERTYEGEPAMKLESCATKGKN